MPGPRARDTGHGAGIVRPVRWCSGGYVFGLFVHVRLLGMRVRMGARLRRMAQRARQHCRAVVVTLDDALAIGVMSVVVVLLFLIE